MSEIPADLRGNLEARVREQIASEVRGDVNSLYNFTLPEYRARRIATRADEPESTLATIREFVGQVHSAQVESIEIESFFPAVERFAGSQAAVVIARVRYNQRSFVSLFRTIWVCSSGTWFSTSLGKWFPPRPQAGGVNEEKPSAAII